MSIRLILLLTLVYLSLQQATVLKRDNMCRACLISTQHIADLVDEDPSLMQDLNLLREKLLDRNSDEIRMALRAVFMSIKIELERIAGDKHEFDLSELRKICESRAYCGKKENQQVQL